MWKELKEKEPEKLEAPMRTVLFQNRLTTTAARWFEAMTTLLKLLLVGGVPGAVSRAVAVALFAPLRPGRI